MKRHVHKGHIFIYVWPLKTIIPRIDTKYVRRSWPFRVTWRHRSRNYL